MALGSIPGRARRCRAAPLPSPRAPIPPRPPQRTRPRRGSRLTRSAPVRRRGSAPAAAGPAPDHATVQVWRGRAREQLAWGTAKAPLERTLGAQRARLGGTSSVREVLGTNRQSRPRAAPRDAQWYVPGRPAGFAPRRRGFLRKGCGHFSEGAWPLQLPDLLSGKHVPERGVVTIEAKSVVIWSQNWVL